MNFAKELIAAIVESPGFKLIVIGSSLFIGGYGAVVLFQENQMAQRYLGCAWAQGKVEARDGPLEEDFCDNLMDAKFSWYYLPDIESLRYRMKLY